ncbi:hypothetical protein ACLOJK_032140 [Asimina triloba]
MKKIIGTCTAFEGLNSLVDVGGGISGTLNVMVSDEAVESPVQSNGRNLNRGVFIHAPLPAMGLEDRDDVAGHLSRSSQRTLLSASESVSRSATPLAETHPSLCISLLLFISLHLPLAKTHPDSLHLPPALHLPPSLAPKNPPHIPLSASQSRDPLFISLPLSRPSLASASTSPSGNLGVSAVALTSPSASIVLRRISVSYYIDCDGYKDASVIGQDAPATQKDRKTPASPPKDVAATKFVKDVENENESCIVFLDDFEDVNDILLQLSCK